jgi:hypothetical protein
MSRLPSRTDTNTLKSERRQEIRNTAQDDQRLCTPMAEPQQFIDESRPMLEEFLGAVGIYRRGKPIADVQLRDQFSDWIEAQEIREEDFWYVVVRVAAFICEYLIEGHNAVRYSDGKHILLRMPVDAAQGVYRDFDPYAVAVGLVRERRSLKAFLEGLCG